MADIAKIRLGVTDFDIKDTIARTELNRINNRKLLIFGDSYFRDPAVSGGNSVKYYLNLMLPLSGMSCDINAQGGEAFGDTGTWGYDFDVNSYVSVFPADDVTDVMFCGGYNDRDYTISQIEAGIERACTAARTKYPNARIHVGHFGWCSTPASTQRSKMVQTTLPAYRNCIKYGAAYMTNSEYTMHDYDLFYSDNVHPTEDGCREIAKQVYLYMLTGTCDVHYKTRAFTFNAEGSPTSEWTSDEYLVGSRLDNDQVTIFIPNAYLTYPTSFNLNHNYWVSICNLTSFTPGFRLHFIGNYSTYAVMPEITLRGNFTRDNNIGFYTFSECECSFTLFEGNLKVNVHMMKDDHTGYEDVSDVIGINIVGQAVTIPTLAC